MRPLHKTLKELKDDPKSNISRLKTIKMSILPKLILWIDYNRSNITERVAKIKKILKSVWKYKNLNIIMISLILL